MAGEWKLLTAREFCASVRDGTHDSPKPVDHGRRLVTSRHITGGRLDLSNAYLISQEDFDAINKRSKVDQWDVLISMIGTVGEPCLIKEKPVFAIKNIGLFKSKGEVEGKWLYYYLRSADAQQLIHEQSRGTTQQYIPLEALREFPIPVPGDPDEMRAIAHILGTLDDKIELNRRMNETLEAMARALFKSWFVDFDPVRAKAEGREPGLPKQLTDLLPARLVESELGEIPEGWEVSALRDALDIADGRTLPADQRDERGPYQAFGANGPIARTREAWVDSPCIILGKIGTCGALHRSPAPCWVTNNAFAIMPGKTGSLEFAWHTLEAIDFSSYIGGSANPYMPLKNYGHHQVILPPAPVLESFQSAAGSLRRRIESNEVQSSSLAALRDALLPKLISGELRVKDAERLMEQVSA